jgi:hypothetical protein
MDKKPKSVYVTTVTIKAANNKLLATKSYKDLASSRSGFIEKFVSRDELKEAFKAASRKMKSA